MRRALKFLFAVLLISPGPAHALRGIEPGESCESVLAAEASLGSEHVGTREIEDFSTLSFRGRYLTYPANISYVCRQGVVDTQSTILVLEGEGAAMSAAQAVLVGLTRELGVPTRDDGPETISATEPMLQDVEPTELHRFVVWERAEGLVALMFTRTEKGWSLAITAT